MSETDLAFEGVRVLDLSQGIAGPYCGMHLARNGADVIKLEPTGSGCWSRQLGRAVGDQTAHSLVVHRGKRSLALDLKSAEGQELAQRLADLSDVVLQNYRVGKIDKLGLDYESVSRRNPAVVYLSITGFGPHGPRADQPATDSVMQAYTGMMSINRDRNGLPQRINMLAIDFATGLYAFQAVSAALYRKAMKGKGKHIQTSLLEAALTFQEAAIIESHLQGGAAEPIGMPVGTFKTADGYMSINARRDPHFKRLCELLGKQSWLTDSRYLDARSRVENGESLLAELRPIIASKTSQEWNGLLSGIDVLNAKVHSHQDLFEDEQVRAIGALHWIEDESLGRVPLCTIAGQPLPAADDRLTHSPHVGEHSVQVLRELGIEQSRIQSLLARGVLGQPAEPVPAT